VYFEDNSAELQHALWLSQHVTKRQEPDIPSAPVFHPTLEEFADPFAYVKKIMSEASAAGICKIVPPKGWNPPPPRLNREKDFPTKLQRINKLQEGKGFGEGQRYTLDSYKRMADAFKEQWTSEHPEVKTTADFEKKFWRMVETQTSDSHFSVEYANDLDTHEYGSGFRSPDLEPATQKRGVGSGTVADGASSPAQTNEKSAESGPADGSTALERADAGRSCSEPPSSSVEPAGARPAAAGAGGVIPGDSTPMDGSGPRAESGGRPAGRGLGRGLRESLGRTVNFGSENYYTHCGWNLNNLPWVSESLLKVLDENVAGVNVPWMYYGMLFASFCWHIEDNELFSCNYMHAGSCKTWYGVPASSSERFEGVIREHVPALIKEKPDLLYSINFLISPYILLSGGCGVVRTVQRPGEFVFTFPRAYHAGFSHGFNIAEAVNFAPPEWLPFGIARHERYRRERFRPSVMNVDKLVFDVAKRLDTFRRGDLCASFVDALLAKLEKIVEENREWRTKLLSLGMREYVLDEACLEDDQQRCCAVCRQNCYVGVVICQCSATNAACLRDYQRLCSCRAKLKVIGTWHSTKDLVAVIERAKEYLRPKAGHLAPPAPPVRRDPAAPSAPSSEPCTARGSPGEAKKSGSAGVEEDGCGDGFGAAKLKVERGVDDASMRRVCAPPVG
jgi:histone demethylase JARID1